MYFITNTKADNRKHKWESHHRMSSIIVLSIIHHLSKFLSCDPASNPDELELTIDAAECVFSASEFDIERSKIDTI